MVKVYILLLISLWLASDLTRANRAVDVRLTSKHPELCGQGLATYFWIPRANLTALGMPATKTCTESCGSIQISSKMQNGAFSETHNLDQINVHDGSDACKTCNACDVAFIQLSAGEQLSGTFRCGDTVSITYQTSPAPSPPPSPPSPPPHPVSNGGTYNYAGIYLELASGAYTAQSLNLSVPRGGVWNMKNNFSFVGPHDNRPRKGCHLLGDISLRIAPVAHSSGGAGGTGWSIFSSAAADPSSWQLIRNASHMKNTLASHDITSVLNASAYDQTGYKTQFPSIPVKSFDRGRKARMARAFCCDSTSRALTRKTSRLEPWGLQCPKRACSTAYSKACGTIPISGATMRLSSTPELSSMSKCFL